MRPAAPVAEPGEQTVNAQRRGEAAREQPNGRARGATAPRGALHLEARRFAEHATIHARLISTIPRMEAVARIIQYREKCYDGSGYSQDGVRGEDGPLGGRMLKVVYDDNAIDASGAKTPDAIERPKSTPEDYDLQVLAAFEESMPADEGFVACTNSVTNPGDSMVVAANVNAAKACCLLPRAGKRNFRYGGTCRNTVTAAGSAAASLCAIRRAETRSKYPQTAQQAARPGRHRTSH